MILAILAFYFGYKKGRESGRSGILWAFICGLTFIGVQVVVSIGCGALLGIGVDFWGWSETVFEDMGLVISLFSIGASVVALLLTLRFLDKVPTESPQNTPPPPPTFDNNDE